MAVMQTQVKLEWRVRKNNIKLFYKEEGKEHQRKKGNPSLGFDSAIIKMCDYRK